MAEISSAVSSNETSELPGGESRIGTILTIRQQSHFIDYRMELVEKQVKALSDKVDKHNNFDRRLVAIETKLDMKQEEKKS